MSAAVLQRCLVDADPIENLIIIIKVKVKCIDHHSYQNMCHITISK